MKFRSHIGRTLDMNLWSNRAMVALSLGAGLAGLVFALVFDRSLWTPLVTAGSVFATWALTREIDPDREASALLAGLLGGIWVLLGFEVALLPLVGFVGVARILSETTGRRPLRTDFVMIAVGASLISFTPLGFVAGFGLAIAIYVDNRIATDHNPEALGGALATAVGSAVVATLTGAFPQELPELQPVFPLALAALALLAVLREPPQPTSLVDSRKKTFLLAERIHVSRITLGLLTVVGALIAGPHSVALTPVAISLAIALSSSELERARR